MIAEIEALLARAQAMPLGTREDLEAYKREITGKNGGLTALFDAFKALPGDQKRDAGKALNQLKQLAETRYAEAATVLEASARPKDQPDDMTLAGMPWLEGSRHPIYYIQEKIVRMFQDIGFTVAEGPEIETDWHNFSALNFEPNHPAREMQDTFFLTEDKNWLLRTHTSSVQVRAMERQKPPLRLVMPGRVYRNEAISARAHCYFNQVEGLVVDKGVTFADMKQTLLHFAHSLFGPDVKMRLRPSYFPFTEVSAEMDVSCQLCHGSGCNVCKHTGWVEVLGCGMIDPNVLKNTGIDPDEYSGYAFGMGVERIAMLLLRVPDLRLYSQNDVRMLQQFASLY